MYWMCLKFSQENITITSLVTPNMWDICRQRNMQMYYMYMPLAKIKFSIIDFNKYETLCMCLYFALNYCC